MREAKRIPKILKRLQKVWKNNPDLRLAQLIVNVYRDDPYYIEDEKFIKEIEEFYEYPA